MNETMEKVKQATTKVLALACMPFRKQEKPETSLKRILRDELLNEYEVFY